MPDVMTHAPDVQVYPYDKWFDRPLPVYEEGDVFVPTSILLHEGATTAPALLMEADLIALMDREGIGTDATIATHIKTIQTREYVKVEDRHFVPTKLGLALVQGYDVMGYALSQPKLRAEMERDMKCIAQGQKTKGEVVARHGAWGTRPVVGWRGRGGLCIRAQLLSTLQLESYGRRSV